MARFCSACGRSRDKDGHDRGEEIVVHDPITKRDRKYKPWICRVRKVAHTFATDLKTGERKIATTYVPDSMQRTKQNMAAYVPAELMKLRA